MHLAVDGSFWGGEERGVAVSTRRLWCAFLQQTRPPRTTVFAPASIEPEIPHASFVPVGPLAGAARLAWQQLALPALVRARDIDLLYSPCYTAPLALPCRSIVTVHDLIAWTHPRLAGWKNALHLRLLGGGAIRRAAAVCVPTEFVKRSVVDRFAIPAGRVFVTPWGVDAEIARLSQADAALTLRRRFGLDQPFVLFCGCIEAKKNVQAAMRAAAQAGLLLVIVGPRISSSPALLSRGARTAGGRWRHLGYVSTPDLSALYSAATALVLPSHTEGFGLPAIEAMRCGCPVITSSAPALREVCGGAAMHVPRGDAAELAARLRTVATDRAFREDLIGRGTARAASFVWAAAADRFAEALDYACR